MKPRKPANIVAIDGGKKSGPAAPAWLHEYAKLEWRRVVPTLQARGMLRQDTQAMIEAYCAAVGAIRDCEEAMVRQGRFPDGESHPAVKVQVAAMHQARSFAHKLGLTEAREEEEGKDGRWSGLLA